MKKASTLSFRLANLPEASSSSSFSQADRSPQETLSHTPNSTSAPPVSRKSIPASSLFFLWTNADIPFLKPAQSDWPLPNLHNRQDEDGFEPNYLTRLQEYRRSRRSGIELSAHFCATAHVVMARRSRCRLQLHSLCQSGE